MKEDTRIDVEQTNKHLKEKILQWLPAPDRISTPINGLMLSRHNEISAGEGCFYQPMIAVAVQGFKRSMVGNEEYYYGELSSMVVAIDMPGSYHITQASPEEPFLSLSIKLDRHIIAQLLTEIPPASVSSNAPYDKGVIVDRV